MSESEHPPESEHLQCQKVSTLQCQEASTLQKVSTLQRANASETEHPPPPGSKRCITSRTPIRNLLPAITEVLMEPRQLLLQPRCALPPTVATEG